jgi:hypothetical protein
MVYNTQNYWVFGLCPSSDILETTKHNVSETGSISVLRRWKTPTQLGPLERANLNQWARSSGEGETPNLLGPLERANLNQWATSSGDGETSTLLGPLETANLNQWATSSSVGGRHLLSWVPYKELTSITGPGRQVREDT